MGAVTDDLKRYYWKVPVLQDDNTIRYLTPNSDPMVHEHPADFYADTIEELVRYTEAVGLTEDSKEWVIVFFEGQIEFTPGTEYHEGEWDTCGKCNTDIWLVAGKWRTWVKGINCKCDHPTWMDRYNNPCCANSYWEETCTTGVHNPEPDD